MTCSLFYVVTLCFLLCASQLFLSLDYASLFFKSPELMSGMVSVCHFSPHSSSPLFDAGEEPAAPVPSLMRPSGQEGANTRGVGTFGLERFVRNLQGYLGLRVAQSLGS